MARDSYYDISQNLRSLALAIEHLRGLDRHGGSQMLERAFAGFTQLPPPNGAYQPETVDWKKELGLDGLMVDLEAADLLALCEARYRAKAKKAHPDQGGGDLEMIRLNMAIKMARDELGA